MKNERNSKKSIKIFAIGAILILICTGATALTLKGKYLNRQSIEKTNDPNDDLSNVVYDIWIYNDSNIQSGLLKERVSVNYVDCHEFDRNFKLYIDGELHSDSKACLGGGVTLVGIDPETNEMKEYSDGKVFVVCYRFDVLDTTKYENGLHELEIKDENNSIVASIIVFVQN